MQKTDNKRLMFGVGNIKAIIFFDIGNCLYDPYMTFRKTLRALKVPYPDELTDNILSEYCYPDDPGTHDHILREAGLGPEEIADYYRIFVNHPVFHPGIPRVLDCLSKRDDLLLGIISDGVYEVQINKLKAWKLDGYFKDQDLIYICADTGDGTAGGLKVSKENDGKRVNTTKKEVLTFHTIFADVRKQYPVEPKNCFMVGDHFIRDFLNPTEAGWNGIWFIANDAARKTRNGRQGPLIPSDLWITDVRRVEEIVGEI